MNDLPTIGKPNLRAILFDGLNHCYDLAGQAEKEGYDVRVMRGRMPTNHLVNGKKEMNFTTLHSFIIDGKAV